jgi:hypothetical protein
MAGIGAPIRLAQRRETRWWSVAWIDYRYGGNGHLSPNRMVEPKPAFTA